ncbi:hypothetical protein DSAG12_01571 [Promethearchaeum syntrophicum]|uniref:Uncharacterized protein n=1 Tax=Promethearchaeum syntrophicum TaxID=2594042 RepID=A0A5B9D9C3_9ARCH|nr:hypothetical protein [Candidatus Prometheoarchaeum syntrophicum]QEE15744.1 hypothetical protein DSAG12_01571 [Candidatus Prometheoarchaeum syntrophicum]
MSRNRTKTSDFGVSKREGHDSRQFYSSRLYDGFIINEKKEVIDRSAEISKEIFNEVLKFNEINAKKIIDESIHLIIVQIPQIDKDIFENFDKWFQEIVKTIKILRKFLITGGRLIILVNNHIDKNVKNSQFYPLHAKITKILINSDMIMRGNVILNIPNKNFEKSLDNLNSNLNIALISSKDVLKRIKKNKRKAFEKTDTITRDQFLTYTKSIWRYNNELMLKNDETLIQSKEITDYIQRFIHLFSFVEDNILYIFPNINRDFMKFAQNHRNMNIFFEW